MLSLPAREGSWLELCIVNREGLVGDVVVEAHNNHKIVSFSFFGKKGRGSELLPWTSKGGTLISLGGWLRESLRSQS